MIEETLKNTHGIEMTFGVGESTVDHSGITLYIDPTSISPPGQDVGDAVDLTTETNAAVRTKNERALKEITDGAFTAAYDPDGWDDIYDAVNDNVLITFTFPDGESVAIYGYLKSFAPSEHADGVQATAECVIVVTNRNHNNDAETIPAYSSAS